nr:hypothetical protein [Gilliamella apicola]
MNKYLGIFAVILASLLWGTTGTAATFAPTLSPLWFFRNGHWWDIAMRISYL